MMVPVLAPLLSQFQLPKVFTKHIISYSHLSDVLMDLCSVVLNP